MDRRRRQVDMENIRLVFPKGCRVRLSAMGRLVARHKRESRVGTVTGHCRDAAAPMGLGRPLPDHGPRCPITGAIYSRYGLRLGPLEIRTWGAHEGKRCSCREV